MLETDATTVVRLPEARNAVPARGFQLTAGDVELLRLVFEYRLAHIDHLSALTGRSYKKLHGRSRNLTEWALNDLIEVAQQLDLVGEGPAKAAQAVRDFRNLIHPDRLLRRSRPRWDALAAMALGAVAEVSWSLSGRITP